MRTRGNFTTTYWAIALVSSLWFAVMAGSWIVGEPLFDRPHGSRVFGASFAVGLGAFWAGKTALHRWWDRRSAK